MSYTVLIVDDEVEVLESLRRVLRNEGYQIVTTASPVEAWQILEKGGIDLLLSDIDMPELSGVELVKRVRAAHPGVVRMLLTGGASLTTALRAINEGEVHRYLTKPWDKQELRAVLREALGRLDELRQAAAAREATARREQLLVELERAHPGLTQVARKDGMYELEIAELETLLGAVVAPSLRGFFEP